MNTLKVGFLMLAMTALVMVIGRLIGGVSGMIIAVVIAAAMNLGSFWFSDKIVLKMTKAQPLTSAQAPEIFAMTEKMAQKAGIPMPKMYIVNDPSPNAFATGRSPQHGVVAVNSGLLQLLNEKEVAGVIAHELGHIKHRDTLTMAIVATMAGMIMILADIARFSAIFGGLGGNSDRNEGGGLIGLLVATLVAPLAAVLIQMGISRAREYEADKIGAELAGTPDGLASALEKLHQGVQRRPSHMPPQAAHLCIVNPFAGMGGLTNLFSTHPPVEERVRRLRAMQ